MKNTKIQTKVVHSKSKAAFNIVGKNLGCKYKIARIPYLVMDNEVINEREKKEAFEHAEFISWCFNNSDKIKTLITL